MNKDLFSECLALKVHTIDNKRITDIDYLRLALRISIRCNIEYNMEEHDEKYLLYFYLKESEINGEYADDWFHLLRASDMHTMAVIRSQPQIIRVTCYRIKR